MSQNRSFGNIHTYLAKDSVSFSPREPSSSLSEYIIVATSIFLTVYIIFFQDSPNELSFFQTSQQALNTGGAYSTTGSSGKPGEVIEYCIDYANVAGVLGAPNFAISDSLPSTMRAWTDGFGTGLGLQWQSTVSGTTTTTTLSSATDSDAGDLSNVRAALRVGTLNSGNSGTFCFQTIIL